MAVRPQPRAAADDLPAYRTKAEVATDVLRRGILSGELAPGVSLTVSALAERFGLTLMPLREALSRLAAEGLVEIEPHQSARVALLTQERMIEEYAIRAIVEAAAAAQAAPRLGADALAELEDLLGRMDRARDARRNADYWALTRRFHERIYAATPSRLLRDEVDRVRTRTLRYLPVFVRDHALISTAQREHRQILRAIRSGDVDKVERIVRDHVATIARSVHLVPEPDTPASAERA